MALKDNLKATDRKGVFYKEHETRKHGVRKDRLWVLRYTINGKTRTEAYGWTTEGLTKIDAEQKIARFKANAKSGDGPTSLSEEREIKKKQSLIDEIKQKEEAKEDARRNTTFGQFFDQIYFPQCQIDKKTHTAKTEKNLFGHWISPVIGDLHFDQISIDHLDRIKANMLSGKRADANPHPRDKKDIAKDANLRRNPAKPMSSRSINYAMAVIRQVWNRACSSNPPLAFGDWPGAVKAFKKPKIDNQRKRFLTKNEAAALLSALKAKSQNLHDMALLSLHCGLRAGEIFALTWDKVNLGKRELLLIDTKNGESRVAYLTDQATDVLRQRSVNCQNQRIVFASMTKGKIKPYKQIPATFARTVKELGLNDNITDRRDKIVFHSLRHTYASWLVENGTSLPIVRDLMGHKNLIMTSRYSHVSADAQKSAVAALNRSINPADDNLINLAAKRIGKNEEA